MTGAHPQSDGLPEGQAMSESTVKELRQIYEARRLVVVAGANVSVAAGVPSRAEVLRHLVQKARSGVASSAERSAAIEEIEGLIRQERGSDAFGALEELLTAPTLGAEVERLWYAEDKPIPEIAGVLSAMAPGLAAVVSLSLDRVLPRAFGGRWHTFARVVDDLGQRTGRHAFLLQLHGTLFERQTWVLTAQQIADASFNQPVRRAMLGAFLRSHTLLFVGCEVGDLDLFLGELASTTSAQPPRHFALVPSGSLGPWRHRRLQDAGIETLGYEDPRGDLHGAAEVLARVGGVSLPLASIGVEEAPQTGEPECPFPGLSCFEERDAGYYFGRDHDVDSALSKLGGPAGVRWLQIEGASGTGKSSLARAGILPTIRKRGVDGGPEDWHVAVMRPGTEPLVALANAVRPLAGEKAPPLDELCGRLEKAGGLAMFLREHLGEREPGEGVSGEGISEGVPGERGIVRRRGFLLVIDQLEEAVTLGGEERAAVTAAFDAALGRALRDADGPLYLVTTIRSDQASRLETGLPQLATLLNSGAARYALRSMQGAALRAAIEAPARKAGLSWEGDLAARVLADAGGNAGGLPLVAHVLRALFDRREGRKLTLSAYEALGGVTGALTKSADDVLGPLKDADKDCARRMLLRLVKIGRGAPDSRQPAGRAEVLRTAGDAVRSETVLDRLAGSRGERGSGAVPVRIVMVGADEDEQRVDLVHEALLRQWTTLAGWIEEHRKALEKRDDLEHQAQAWDAAGRSDSGLATGAQLAYLRGAESPNELGRGYLQRSEKRDRRRRILQRIGIAAVIATAGGMSALAWWANEKRDDANRRLEQAIEMADHVTLVVDQELEPIAGAAAIRKKLLAKTAELQDNLIAGAPDSMGPLRSRMVTHGMRGDLALSHDNLALALKEYKDGLKIADQLVKADPQNILFQRDLAISYANLGAALKIGGDLEGARVALAAADPQNTSRERALTIIHERLGALREAEGDLKGARDFFERDLDITKALATADPTNGELQLSLAFTHKSLAALAIAMKDPAAQKAHTAAARAIVQSMEKSGKMLGRVEFTQLKAYLDTLPP